MAEVVIYTRQLCGFCTAAKRLFNEKGTKFIEHDGTFDPVIREEMKKKSQRATFPQIFIGEVHVGGCDDLFDLEDMGKLDLMLSV